MINSHMAAVATLSAKLPNQAHKPVPFWLAGQRCSVGNDTFATLDPTTGQTLFEVVAADDDAIDRAVAAAGITAARWWRTDGQDRARALRRIADAVRNNAEILGLADTLDVGRPIRDTVTRDAERAARLFEFWVGATDRLRGAQVPVQPGFHNVTTYEPYGVVGAITPWNYPLTNAATKVAPALATGNAVVLKPAEESPISALLLATFADEAGLPAGPPDSPGGSIPSTPVTPDPLRPPYGGYGQSGVGLEMGLEAVTQLMRTKSVWTAVEPWRSPWS